MLLAENDSKETLVKTQNSFFDSNLINFQNASRSMNPSWFDNFLDPLKFPLGSFGESDIFSKPSDWANFWNLNRCVIRIDIFERIFDVHQEFCDIQSGQILTIKLKNLEKMSNIVNFRCGKNDGKSWCTSIFPANMSMRITYLCEFQKLAQTDGFEKISASPKFRNENFKGSRKLSKIAIIPEFRIYINNIWPQ